jgi:polyvinyl alcohol dehydrogenase (cytochrome)
VAVLALLAVACGGGEDRTGADRDRARTATATTDAGIGGGCEWSMYGHGPARTFALPTSCTSTIDTTTVADLTRAWLFTTDDVVTATPAVVDGTVYVGDWSGAFYAIDAETGDEVWRVNTDVHPTVYSGQIVSSAAVADVGGRRLVYVGAGKTMYAWDATDGEEVWRYDVAVLDKFDAYDGDAEVPDPDRPTEIESSPLVIDGTVIFGFDAHDRPGFRGGVVALDAATGALLWDFDPDQGAEPTGCGGVWGSPSADPERGLVFASTANCGTMPDEWGPYAEALFALDLETGEPQWSFQPHEPYNNNDFDLPGAPNLFEIGERAVVGVGGKDGRYHVVDRETGELVWEAVGQEPDYEEGAGFTFGGFIGPLAVGGAPGSEVVAGGTAGNGPTACPCLHGFDAATGEERWHAGDPQPVYGASAIVGDVLFAGGTDFTLRAVDLHSGETQWSADMPGVVAGGVAIVGDDVFAVAGIREPGTTVDAESAGVTRFTLNPDAAEDTSATTTTVAPDYDGPIVLESPDQPCVGAPCDIRFAVLNPPEGLTPTGTLVVETDPFSIRMELSGMGDPEQWVAPNAPDADEGADEFTLVISVSDERPLGAAVCTFEPTGESDVLVCEADTIPLLAPQYNRLSILALPADAPFPEVAEGVARLAWTNAFDTPLVLVDPPPSDTTSETAPSTGPTDAGPTDAGPTTAGPTTAGGD